jgi:hypothetical protein
MGEQQINGDAAGTRHDADNWLATVRAEVGKYISTTYVEGPGGAAYAVTKGVCQRFPIEKGEGKSELKYGGTISRTKRRATSRVATDAAISDSTARSTFHFDAVVHSVTSGLAH